MTDKNNAPIQQPAVNFAEQSVPRTIESSASSLGFDPRPEANKRDDRGYKLS